MNTAAAALVESAKRAAAYRAVEDHLDPAHRYVGIGSGSTVAYVVEAIAARGPAFSAGMTFFPTGSQSSGLIRAAELRLCGLDERPVAAGGSPVRLDVAFDGADEVDEALNCIKGGGACLLREKLVAVAAARFVVVADYRKLSARLCTRWKTIPIEVLPLAAPDVLARLRALGSATPAVRSGLPAKAGECVTDNGMWIIDAPFPPLLLPGDMECGAGNGGGGGDGDADGEPPAGASSWEVSALAEEIVRIPGVVEVGLFTDRGPRSRGVRGGGPAQKPVAAYFGMADGTVSVRGAGVGAGAGAATK